MQVRSVVTRFVVLAALVWACAAPGAGRASASPTPPSETWLIAGKAINLIDGYVGNSSLTTNAFDNPSTLVEGTSFPTGSTAQRVATFSNYKYFSDALTNGTIPQDIKYVLYDQETWKQTPGSQRGKDAGEYMIKFVTLAHDNNLKAILAPAINLTQSMPCHTAVDKKSTWAEYLTDCNIPSYVAQAHPDIYEIQAQQFENDTTNSSDCGCYRWFVTQAAAEATSVAPIPQILAGLSTNVSGVKSSAATLLTDTVNTESVVGGYWLNVPNRTLQCPTCTASGNPEVAAVYLWGLGFVGVGSQTITFPLAQKATVGTTATLKATGGHSTAPVTYSIDAASAGVCSLTGSKVVTYTAIGTCVIHADQAATGHFSAAPERTKRVTVGAGS